MPFTKSTDISNATVFSGSPINTRINNSETYLDLYDDDIESIRLGWIPVTIAGVAETWTYNSVSGILGTITVASDATTRFQKGDKIRFVQSSTTKYFYITAVTATTITVTGGTNYTLTNSAISDIYLSRIENPFGFPNWFNYTISASGTSGSAGSYAQTVTNSRFHIRNNIVTNDILLVVTNKGSWGGAVYLSLPITAIAGQTDRYISGSWGTANNIATPRAIPTIGTTANFAFSNNIGVSFLTWSAVSNNDWVAITGIYIF